jgi:archaellum component FlaC
MTYDYRNRTASDDDDADEKAAKAEEQLEDLMSQCGEAASEAEQLQNALSVKTESDLGEAIELAALIYGDLNTAGGGIEKLSDLVACVKEVQVNIPKLEAALKEAKREAKRGKDGSALEAIDEALDYVRGVKRELNGIDDAIAEAQESLEEAEKAR